MEIQFGESTQSTLGVEWEIALVDAVTGELTPRADALLGVINQEHPELQAYDEHPHIKRELLLNTLELVTGVCGSVVEAKEDLSRSLDTVREAAAR